MKRLFYILAVSCVVISCNKKENYEQNIGGSWNLDKIETVAIDGEEIKPETLSGDNFLRMVMDPSTNSFMIYISWDNGETYSEGNGGSYYFSEDKKYLYFDFSSGSDVLEQEIVKLNNRKMQLYIEDGGTNLEGETQSFIYYYKKVEWTP